MIDPGASNDGAGTPRLDGRAGEHRTVPVKPSYRGWLLAGALIVGAVVLAAVLASRFGNDSVFADSPLIGKPLPDVTLQLLDGSGDVFVPDLQGKIAVINFWASWCFPCRNEHEMLEAAAEEFEEAQIYGIIFKDSADRANEFLDELGRGYPHLLDPDSRGATAFGVLGPPETYFVDEYGIVVAKIVGEMRGSVLEDTIARILRGEQLGQRTLGTVQARPGS